MVVFVIRASVKVSGSCVAVGARNRMHESVFIIRMFAYSAKKNRAKGPAAYSTLKPETSSDSPSVKSNGARLVSATVEMYHIIAKGQDQVISHVGSCVERIAFMVNPPMAIVVDRRIRPSVTS